MFKTIKNVLKHSVIYGAGDILAKLVGFFLIPLYTHYFSTAEYGTLELLDLTAHIIAFFLAMGIGEAMVRFYFDSKDEEYRETVVSVSLLATWSISLASLLILFPNAERISLWVFESSENAQLFYLVFASLALQLCNEIPLQLLRIEQRSILYTVISLIRVFIQLSLNIYFIVVAELGIAGILLSTLITNALLGAVLTVSILRRIRLRFSLPLFKEMLIYGAPLVGTWSGNFLLHFADRFLLQRLGSLSAVGVYSLSYKFGFLVNLFVLVPFKKTWMPKQFEIAGEADAQRTYARMFTYYCFAQLYFTLGLSALIEDAISVIAEEKFHSAYAYVPLLLLAYNFNGFYQFWNFALLYRKRTRLLAAITLTAGLFNIACNAVLIPRFGVWGATWSTLISFMFLSVCTFIPAQRLYHIPFEYRRLLVLAITAAALYLLTLGIQLENVFASMLTRGVIAAAFPLLLFLTPFFDEDEREFIDRMWRDRRYWRSQLSALLTRNK